MVNECTRAFVLANRMLTYVTIDFISKGRPFYVCLSDGLLFLFSIFSPLFGIDAASFRQRITMKLIFFLCRATT